MRLSFFSQQSMKLFVLNKAKNVELYKVKHAIDSGYTPNRGILQLYQSLTSKYFTFAFDVNQNKQNNY